MHYLLQAIATIVAWAMIAISTATAFTSCAQEAYVRDTTEGSPQLGVKPDTVSTQILQALDDGQHLPKGFYSPPKEGDFFTTYYHVKSTDLPDMSGKIDSKYDVCSTSEQQAFNWSEEALGTREKQMQLYSSDSTPLYYEYGWQDPNQPNTINWYRVFNCNFIDRSEYDWENPGPVLGRLLVGPVKSDIAKVVAEYLWYFSPKNNYGYYVLDSRTTRDDTEVVQSITELTHPIEPAPAISDCKTYFLMRDDYSINKQTGLIEEQESLINTYSIRDSDQGYQFCG